MLTGWGVARRSKLQEFEESKVGTCRYELEGQRTKVPEGYRHRLQQMKVGKDEKSDVRDCSVAYLISDLDSTATIRHEYQPCRRGRQYGKQLYGFWRGPLY